MNIESSEDSVDECEDEEDEEDDNGDADDQAEESEAEEVPDEANDVPPTSCKLNTTNLLIFDDVRFQLLHLQVQLHLR